MLFFFADGAAFFAGWAGITLVMLLLVPSVRWWNGLLGTLGLLIGAGMIYLSATPMPGVVYLIWLMTGVAWFIVEHRSEVRKGVRWGVQAAVVGTGLVPLLMEMPYHNWPGISAVSAARLYIVADSVSAGLGQREIVTWPNRFRQEHGVEVVDLSEAGATVLSIQSKVRDVKWTPGLVLLEIGGNDLLGRTTPVAFEAELERLIGLVGGPGRVLVMFELPLPPMRSEFGRIQRAVAKRHQIVLIPKKYFADILREPANTLDGIHLSALGHERMSNMVWKLLGSAFSGKP